MSFTIIEKYSLCVSYWRGKRIQTIFFPTLVSEYCLVSEVPCALLQFDRCKHYIGTNSEIRKNHKWIIKLLLDSVMKSQSQPNLELIYIASKSSSGIICAGRPILLVLNYIRILFGARTAFCSAFVNCLMWWDPVLVRVSRVMEVNTNFCIALVTTNNYF